MLLGSFYFKQFLLIKSDLQRPFCVVCLLNVFVVIVVVSHIHRIGCQPEKLLYTVANPARGLLNREKRTKEKVWQRTRPHPPHCSFGENK